MKYIRLLLIIALFSCEDDFGSSSSGIIEQDASTGDVFGEIIENYFVDVSEHPVSTFSIDADGASYSNVRRYIDDGHLPPSNAVRTEEFINFFDLDYEHTTDEAISVHGEISRCPWNTSHKLMRIGIVGEPLGNVNDIRSNFVFLIDVSGSMNGKDRLDLLKKGLIDLVDQLNSSDRIAIVTYAGSAKVHLPSTSVSEDDKIKIAIDRLGAGGSTAGAQGIITAYEIAEQAFMQGGNNRIIIGTDGDFNVGISDHDELVTLIEEKRESGIYLTVLGVGRGNYNDYNLEQIANHGNGNFEYVSRIEDIQKVFIHEKSKFFTVANDVKIQIEFNPEVVSSYRLIGYENRLLNEEDFEDDAKDAGEIGADQTITALYEYVPVDSDTYKTQETFTIDIRYKEFLMEESRLIRTDVSDKDISFENSTEAMRFSSGVVGFAMLLRDSPHKGSVTYADVIQWLESQSVPDPYGYKEELIDIVKEAQSL